MGLLPHKSVIATMQLKVGICVLLSFIFAAVVSCTSESKKNPQSDNATGAAKSIEPTATTLNDFLRFDAVHPIHLKISDEGLESLRKKPRKYVAGEFEYGGVTRTVSVKLKGHRSFRNVDEKPAIKLRFDKIDPNARFLGQRRLTLNNMVDDPTRMRESVGYAVYRAAGLAAPRTAYADLTINGKLKGTYLIVEPIDDIFVANQFGAPIGGLYEAEYGCDVFPQDIARFERDHGPESSREHLAAVAQAAQIQSPVLWEDNNPLIDSNAVVTYLAVSALLGDFDGYWHSHNYFLYQNGPRGTWSILPWGIDRVFNDELGLWGSRGRLAEVCFADSKCSLAYASKLVEVSKKIEAMNLNGTMRRIFASLGNNPLVDRDPWDETPTEVRQKKRRIMRDFINNRPKRIRETLSCLKEGVEIDPDSDGFGCNDCDSSNSTIHPGATEVCDGVDNDCNGLVDDAAECPCEVLQVNDAKFHLCEWRMSWREASDFCVRKGLKLAAFDNGEQSSSVFEAAKELDDNRWWIGASDLAVEGIWRWSSGKELTWSHWDDGQPNDNQCGQDCAALDDVGDGRWVDAHCEQHFPFVCR